MEKNETGKNVHLQMGNFVGIGTPGSGRLLAFDKTISHLQMTSFSHLISFHDRTNGFCFSRKT